MPPVIYLPPLHRTQQLVHDEAARFTVLACGRRWGKTRYGALRCLATALEGGAAWWVAPTYKMSNVGWRLTQGLAEQIPGARINKSERRVEFTTGGWVEIRSADSPVSLRSEGLDYLVMDECAFIKEEAWSQSLRPTLTDRKGGALFISTPKGYNWFWRLWNAAMEGRDTWRAFRFCSADNPKLDKAEIEAARLELPERVFAQEYMAEFLDDAGGVFRGVARQATADWQYGALEDHQYVFGVDWGKENDYTVVAVFDLQLQALVFMDRFNQVDYVRQLQRVGGLAERFRPMQIIAEKNNVGSPLIDAMRREGMPVYAFVTSASSKQTIVDNLALAFDQSSVTVIPDTTLVSELQAFQSEQMATHTRYGAPDGVHDDCVMAACLGWYGAQQRAKVRQSYFG